MNKKLMAGAAAVAVLATFAAVFVASAQTVPTNAYASVSATSANMRTGARVKAQTILRVGPKGNAFMRGTIASVSGDVITVNSSGGTWTANVSSATKILPKGANGTIAQFQVGDSIGVFGPVSTSTNWTINAKVVRDRTMARAMATSTPSVTQ